MLNKEMKEVGLFFLLTIFLSFFVFWGPIAFFKVPTVNMVEETMGPVWAILLFIIGGFIPSIVGLILTRIYEGKKGVKDLFRQSFQVKFSLKWYGLILIISLYFAFSLILINTVITGKTFDYKQFIVQLGSFVPLIILGPLSEEYGWRGFANKRLINHVNSIWTSLIIGLVWSLWHLPLFYMVGSFQNSSGMPFIVFLITTTSTSFIYTYLYLKTKNSLFSAIFFHWIYTYCIQVVASTVKRTTLYSWLEFVPMILMAFVFIFLLKKNQQIHVQTNKHVKQFIS